jgi:hypothetical protein
MPPTARAACKRLLSSLGSIVVLDFPVSVPVFVSGPLATTVATTVGYFVLALAFKV